MTFVLPEPMRFALRIENVRQRPVTKENLAGHGNNQDAIKGILDDRPEFFLALPERLFGFLAFGDVKERFYQDPLFPQASFL